MATLKCKMCGGIIEIKDINSSVISCEYCGTTQTIPTLDNEKKNLLHNRANTFRLKNEFDKAILTYENIVEEFTNDSEAYWGLVLCKYGIEYVDDPKTGIKIPTCHRTKTKSIFDDIDYQNAIKYSDVIARNIMITEAKEIDRLQKEILVLSQKEEPYDIFICYKETDESGKRTIDSVIAQDIYDELTRKGYKVFFARITLESKLGREYEPIIYAALTSSKAMLVIGTKPEYFNAVWVKNEWARFIDMMGESDNQKYLIPCYKDIDAYDLPEELVSYQCQDLNKLGYMQDLTRGLDKIFDEKQTIKVTKKEIDNNKRYYNTNTNSKYLNLLKRVQLSIEDKDYDIALRLIENVLNDNAECAEAYLYLLLIDLKLTKIEELSNLKTSINQNKHFVKALRFATDDYKKELIGYSEKIEENIRVENCERIYLEATALKIKNIYSEAIKAFSKILDYKDSRNQVKLCEDKINEYKELLYQEALEAAEKENYDRALDKISKLDNYKDVNELKVKYEKLKSMQYIYVKGKFSLNSQTLNGYTEAINLFSKIPDYKDSKELIEKYKNVIDKINKQNEIKKAKLIKNVKIAIPIAIALTVFVIILFSLIIPSIKLSNSRKLIEDGDYKEAIILLDDLDGFGDSENLYDIIYAYKNLNNGDYETAISFIEGIGGTINIDYDSDGGELKIVSNKYISVKTDYLFTGWDIVSYKIINLKNNYSLEINLKPIWLNKSINENITYLYLGMYPQTQITDNTLINTLQNINNTNELGYIEYNDNEYKEYKGNFYLVEPIKWEILESNNNTYKLVSDVILDQSVFYVDDINNRTINNNTIYPNNYQYSIIRAWLNGYNGTSYNVDNYTGKGFIDIAFTEEEKKLINATNVDNSASTTDSTINKYACNNTKDKIYLLSCQDVYKYFTSDDERKAKPTDYAIARGVYGYDNGNFWLRSPYEGYSSHAYVVSLYGDFNWGSVNNSGIGARPSLEITIK